ncbi:ComGF family competence protein [Clostridium sp. P21]|uniref:ComGF family competence protein n=2 Tax=Clostridium muellerianum TaxID=2716538 RepID=A0A7Y0EDB9_9CLOT|nr:competence type IV pilus minor pilin ComGF [Clostridium muellerianum]NMM61391.1 ComGF family competence protein [Clostridium muellerianum]
MLIELMLVISLIGIITSVQAVVMGRYMKIHRQEINSSRESFYINEAFMIIQHEIDDGRYIKIKGDNVIVIRSNKGRFDYIRKDKDSDIIISYGSEYFSTPNNILKNIKNFNVKKDKHVMYISIETKKGNVYKRCFPIEREKEQEGLS